MAFAEVDIRGGFLVLNVFSMWNRLTGEWYWETDAIGITPEIATYVYQWRVNED